MTGSDNTFETFLKEIEIDSQKYKFFDIPKINDEKYGKSETARPAKATSELSNICGLLPVFLDLLPYSIRILLESAVRNCDEYQVTSKDVKNILNWPTTHKSEVEIPFLPSRVILQDFTYEISPTFALYFLQVSHVVLSFSGVPAVVDFAAMRDAIKALGGDPQKINPICPADLVIDHSIQVDVARRYSFDF